MKRFTLSLCLLLLIGCSPALTATPLTAPPSETPTATPTAASQACAYMWASQNLTDLTLELQEAIKDVQPDAQAYAFAFGEDCIYEDGHKTFSAMETDFNVTLQVTDLADENELGNWIIKTMQVIETLPKEKIVGPRPGRVTMIFTVGSDQKFFNFYIDKYQALPKGMAGWEIYQSLQTQQ